MTDAQRRRMEKLQREKVFLTDNAADFPKDSPVDKVSVLINPKMDAVIANDAALTVELGEKRAAQEEKDAARDRLLELLRDFATGAIAIGDDVPGITAQFRVPVNRSDQNLIAAATAFYEASAPHADKFKDVGLENADRENLNTFRDDFATARSAWQSAAEEHAEAVGTLDALFREMMALSAKRSALVKLKYRNNPGKLAAWTVASHLDRAPQRLKETPTV